MTGICIALLILLYPFHPSSVYGQTSAITMPTNVTLGQNDLNITCTPSSGFKSVLVISLQRTHSNITSSIVTIHANKVSWNAKYSVKHRSILKGQGCTPPVLEVFIAKDKILLSDAGLYSCLVIGHTSTNDIYHATSRDQRLTVIVNDKSYFKSRSRSSGSITYGCVALLTLHLIACVL